MEQTSASDTFTGGICEFRNDRKSATPERIPQSSLIGLDIKSVGSGQSDLMS